MPESFIDPTTPGYPETLGGAITSPEQAMFEPEEVIPIAAQDPPAMFAGDPSIEFTHGDAFYRSLEGF